VLPLTKCCKFPSFCTKISQSDTLWEFKAQTRFENIIATGIIASVLYCNVVWSVLMVLYNTSGQWLYECVHNPYHESSVNHALKQLAWRIRNVLSQQRDRPDVLICHGRLSLLNFSIARATHSIHVELTIIIPWGLDIYTAYCGVGNKTSRQSLI